MSEMEGSLSQALWQRTLDTVVDRFGLQEQLSEDGGPYLPLTCHAPMFEGSVGQVRVFKGGPLFQLVTSTIVVPPIQLDSHMMFAFMPSDSAVPHFTLDSVRAGGHHAFHLDLIPRVDLGSRLGYMEQCFTPLTEAHERGEAIEGLSKAALSPRQYAIMSPWMLASRANEEAFAAIDDSVDEYLDHWFGLVENGVSPANIEGITREELVARDARNKAIIFNAEIDKVWDQILPLIGQEAVDTQIALLRATSE
jgi:hypothetical protein